MQTELGHAKRVLKRLLLSLKYHPVGFDFPTWKRLIRENEVSSDPRYRAVVAVGTLLSLQNSLLKQREERLFGAAIQAAEVESPLFVLGHWRSGTTHLHRLLAQDERFKYPALYEVLRPHSFLSLARNYRNKPIPRATWSRQVDQMRQGVLVPEEDEWALFFMTTQSPIGSLVFPHNWDRYQHYLDFSEASSEEVTSWKAQLVHFFRKLCVWHKKSLLIKSPHHTARIRLVLSVFPDAKFIHIIRNPYSVFQSSYRLLSKSMELSLQVPTPDPSALQHRVLERYSRLYEAFFAQRALIEPSRLFEVQFEEVEAAPIESLRRAYLHLDLGDFGQVEPRLRSYLESTSDYEKNVYPALSPALRGAVAERWARSFEEYDYPR